MNLLLISVLVFPSLIRCFFLLYLALSPFLHLTRLYLNRKVSICTLRSSLYSSVLHRIWWQPTPISPAQTCSHVKLPSAPAPVLSFRELVQTDASTQVYVLFSISELAQDETCLSPSTSDLTTVIKQFQFLTQYYGLTYHNDLYMNLSNNLILKEHRHVLEKAHGHADQIQQS